MKKLSYKGIKGIVEYDKECNIYTGKIKGHPEIVFDGEDLHDAKSQFEYVVDNFVLKESD